MLSFESVLNLDLLGRIIPTGIVQYCCECLNVSAVNTASLGEGKTLL